MFGCARWKDLVRGMIARTVGKGDVCAMQLERRVADRFSLSLLETYNPGPMRPECLKCTAALGILLRLAHVIGTLSEHPRKPHLQHLADKQHLHRGIITNFAATQGYLWEHLYFFFYYVTLFSPYCELDLQEICCVLVGV